MVRVADSGDARLDDFRDLARADRRPDRPGGRGLVIAEGTVVVRRLLDSGYPLRSVLGVQPRIDELHDDLAGCSAPVYVATAETMAAVVGFHLNRGVLAVADRPAQPDPGQLVANSRTLAVLEGVGDHENLGSLFRNAAALGVDAVLLGAGCSDPLYRRSVRVSMGHVLRVPFASLAPWPARLDLIRQAGLSIAALTPQAGSVDLGDLSARAHGPLALLLGSEGHGLSPDALRAADLTVRIPLADEVDSLNVATAGALAFYELARPGRHHGDNGYG